MFNLSFRNRHAYERSIPFLRGRWIHIFNSNKTNLNMSKMLDDIQNHKLNYNSRNKTSRHIESPQKLIKSTKKISSRLKLHNFDTIKNGSINMDQNNSYSITNQYEVNFQNECDNSIDIFKKLDLESSFDDINFIMPNFVPDEEEYFTLDDIYLTKKNLLSYIHVCIFNDQLAEAHSFLLDFIGKFSSSFTSNDISNCFELLVKGWARKGNTETVKELIDYIQRSLSMRPTLQIYEYYLLSLSKQIKESSSKDITLILEDMRSNGLNPEYLLSRSTLNSSENKMITTFLHRHNIRLKFKKYIHPKLYNNYLVDGIMSRKQQHYDPFAGIDLSKFDQFIQEQFDAEMNSVVKVVPIDTCFYDTQEKKPQQFYKDLINQVEAEWRVSLTKGFENYLKLVDSKHKKLNGIPFIHYITLLEPEIYVEAMLEEIRKCASFSEHYSPFATQLFETLGRKVMSQYLLRSNTNDGTLNDFKECYKKYAEYTTNPKLIMKYNPRQYWQLLIETESHYYFDDTKCWPSNILKEIGKDLYEIISNETFFNSITMKMSNSDTALIQPVISIFYKNHDTFKTKKEIRIHPLLIKMYEGAFSFIHFEPERLPMLSPPVPWISASFGGNLLHRSFIIRLPTYFPKHKLKKIPVQQLYPTLDSINALSLCPWIINEKILDLAIHVFKNKGSLQLDIPVSLSHFGPLPRASSEMCSKERAVIYHQRKLKKKELAETYSLWVDCMYKLAIGNFLRNRVFWFPINTDFRSRVYPIPPNFNHLGSDLSRSLLLFAKGKHLGEHGFKWLKIHLINLTGLKKKCTPEERLAYADEIIELIMDSADNPLEGKKWWMESDEKWQTLACCIEVTNAIRSGDPHNYISHIPVHQDGSCNGLQHYAALGRDVIGAKSVNLSPSIYPQDVYSDVAALVELEIDKDLENGIEIAKVVKNFISRKIVKQTVMTYVYGVTKYGAKLQVLKRLKEDSNFPEEHKVTASLYISEKIFLSISKMFTQTRIIQDWLTDCAQIISNDYNSTVDWVTPLGFPVIQSYYKTPKKNSSLTLIPNSMKQKNAFPANFIHSLDSSHMMLTSLECHRNGLTFASVHDCYWTHASQIDQMNYFCRKQFVALHSEPILDNLSVYLKNRIEYYNANKNNPRHLQLVKQVNQTIPKGNFDLKSVMDSVYFFS